MSWKEIHTASGTYIEVDAAKEQKLEEAKKDLPIIQKEAASGLKPFELIKFQPVLSAGRFEAEFAVKGDDVIFHIWPHGYHEAERDKRHPPRFPKGFADLLVKTMGSAFDPMRIEIHEDRDIGAWFVKAIGYGSSTFYRELSIKAVTSLHKAMGGD